jgi:outer membrane protein OmpA-like peptidoglycan-associated protein
MRGMRNVSLVMALIFALSCRKHEAVAPATTSTQPPPTASAAATTTSVPAADADDLVGLEQGAFVVVAPQSIDYGTGAFRIVDGDPKARFASAEGQPTGHPIVIALPQRVSIDRVQFDTATAGLDTHTPKRILVEMSDTSATDGFKPIANVALATMKDGQLFPADGNVAGRFVRVTATENYGGPLTEIGEFRAYGKKLETTPMPNVSGDYDTSNWRTLHLKHDGNSVSGCLGDPPSPFTGGVEGHVVKINIDTEDEKGPAIIVFSPDGKSIFGGYWKTNGVESEPSMTPWEGKKISDKPGDCPSDPAKTMATTLEKEKRLRLYGINFDSDSDKLRDESKPTLDLVVQVLKQHPDWKLTIEGHTDSTATAEHNQQLSVARANSVKAYLVAAGTDAARLTPAGFGATHPVASNDTQLGRAANRRVELVRE